MFRRFVILTISFFFAVDAQAEEQIFLKTFQGKTITVDQGSIKGAVSKKTGISKPPTDLYKSEAKSKAQSKASSKKH